MAEHEHGNGSSRCPGWCVLLLLATCVCCHGQPAEGPSIPAYDTVVMVAVSGLASKWLNISATAKTVLHKAFFSLSARTTYPPYSLSAISSALFSADPADTGIVDPAWGGFDTADVPPAVDPVSICDLLSCQQTNATQYAIVRERTLEPLFRRHCQHGCVDQCASTVLVGHATSDGEAVATAIKLLGRARPDLLFLQLRDAADAAAASGHGSPQHTATFDPTLDHLSRLHEAAVSRPGQRNLVFVICDVGYDGHSSNGTMGAMDVPVLVMGRDVAAGAALSGRLLHPRDMAPTLATVMGLDWSGTTWTGVPLTAWYKHSVPEDSPDFVGPPVPTSWRSEDRQPQSVAPEQTEPAESQSQSNEQCVGGMCVGIVKKTKTHGDDGGSPMKATPGTSTVTHLSGEQAQQHVRSAIREALGELGGGVSFGAGK